MSSSRFFKTLGLKSSESVIPGTLDVADFFDTVASQPENINQGKHNTIAFTLTLTTSSNQLCV